MNFIVGFILMVSGSREKESFWFFMSLMAGKRQGLGVGSNPADMCGVNGFFLPGFPALID